ncbi:endonuclease/exonuclease/phosphatase family protein [Streptomyces sp. NPDC048491]|uniref:endonuclease/exonuclease/phosphatase family protein n=1 Tax=Streptomyces sp. NPDC048491 TaxID=3157207 RepID=UPI003417E40F
MDTLGTKTMGAGTMPDRDRMVGEQRRHPWRVVSALAGALLLAGVSVVVGCRVVDSDGVTPVPQALAFLPWLLVPGGAGLVFAVLGRWRTGMVWGVAVLAVTGWYTQPYGAAATQPKGSILAEFQVLTSNTEFGWATDDLIATVKRERPDLVFVEECSFRCADALAADLPKADYPYRDVVREDGSAGSAILSRFPLRAVAPIESVMAMPGAVVTIGGRDVRIQLAHPSPPLPGDDTKWHQELGRIREFARTAKGDPVIVAGDFNATQDHALFRSVLEGGALHDSARLTGQSGAWSWPADRSTPLRTQIDHVLVSGDFKATSARFLKLRGTDHRALLVGLSLYGG